MWEDLSSKLLNSLDCRTLADATESMLFLKGNPYIFVWLVRVDRSSKAAKRLDDWPLADAPELEFLSGNPEIIVSLMLLSGWETL